MVHTSGQPESRGKWYPKEKDRTYDWHGDWITNSKEECEKGGKHEPVMRILSNTEYERMCRKCGKVVEHAKNI